MMTGVQSDYRVTGGWACEAYQLAGSTINCEREMSMGMLLPEHDTLLESNAH